MKPGTFYTIKVIYKHTAQRPTAAFHVEKTYSWNAQPQDCDDIITASFTLNGEPVKPIVDIFGLSLAKKIE